MFAWIPSFQNFFLDSADYISQNRKPLLCILLSFLFIALSVHPCFFTQSLKIVTTTLDMKQGQLGAGLHQLGGALETGLSEVDIIISISLRYLVDLFNECQIEILLNFNRNVLFVSISFFVYVSSIAIGSPSRCKDVPEHQKITVGRSSFAWSMPCRSKPRSQIPKILRGNLAMVQLTIVR